MAFTDKLEGIIFYFKKIFFNLKNQVIPQEVHNG